MTVLADTSAWIELFRGTGSAGNVRLRDLISSGERIATTDVVILELLQGATTPDSVTMVWGAMNWCQMLPVRPLFEYEAAAALFHRCRTSGFRPRNSNDLLIAAVAIARKVPLLTIDTDFESIASVSSLELVPA